MTLSSAMLRSVTGCKATLSGDRCMGARCPYETASKTARGVEWLVFVENHRRGDNVCFAVLVHLVFGKKPAKIRRRPKISMIMGNNIGIDIVDLRY